MARIYEGCSEMAVYSFLVFIQNSHKQFWKFQLPSCQNVSIKVNTGQYGTTMKTLH